MSDLVAFHDQVAQYLKSDAFSTIVDQQISFEILAGEFEYYWRTNIANELKIHIEQVEHEENITLPDPFKLKILLSVWKLLDGLN